MRQLAQYAMIESPQIAAVAKESHQMTEPHTKPKLRDDRRIYVYLSKQAWEALLRLNGNEKGTLSPTINELIIEEDRRRNPHYYE